MTDLLDVLLAGGRRADRALHVEHLPGRAGRTSDWPAWADPDLVAGYRALGVDLPWQHQVQAADAVHAGRHTVLATSTGSGKSLAFWLPSLTAVRAPSLRRGSVLYLSPTKALAADQLTGLERLLTAAHVPDVRVATCDGDTDTTARRWVIEHADVVLTNPDFLHFSLLPSHRRWMRVLRGLRVVVLDESHAYRGVFGAHVAVVLRRLLRLARGYGAEPAVVLASATTSDPAATAARLIGVEADQVVAVTDDAAPRGRTTLVLWQPPLLPGSGSLLGAVAALRSAGSEAEADTEAGARTATAAHTGQDGRTAGEARTGEPATGDDGEGLVDAPPSTARRAAPTEVADLLADLVAAGARALAFTRSRRAAESVAAMAREHLDEVAVGLGDGVAAYRGGYLPEERRELEARLRSGELRALATTNALELGVDITGLDAVLIAGWPGTRVSLWQQAGRAGRAGADGLVTLVAREDPLDTYLVHHPEDVVGVPVEATVVDPTNPYVLAPHLCAAAAERPLRSEDLPLFGPDTRALLDVLVDRGALRRRESGWYWTHADAASRLTDLRGTGGEPVRVVEDGTGRLLGTVDASAADATLHEGAVYVHQGRTYVVDALDLTAAVAIVHEEAVDHRTWAHWMSSVEIREVREERHAGPITWGFGVVDATSQVVSYTKRRLPDLANVGGDTLELPPRTMRTNAVWWTAPPEVLDVAQLDSGDAPGALHAAEHASIGLLPLLATCDRWDLGGLSTALHADTGTATVFVHDAYPGGAGFAERGFRLGARWLGATRDAIAGCSCASGCPACVQSPKCGNGNDPLDKAGALRLLDVVLGHES
ncbi:DEAD/DEAH box helicase [Actinotalea sp. M2MS4P-6]|uniref:DEAD/DEAH box helicase n=1 Tax=Actinotalea sp. M2MS4P-6 TaxID=2983762 RepID=UPI0021E35927|nr:DEAD/DEAH box helicase [Actinotalea sp. M2MS4P-6]MCV2394905.1 DEAD/DEAH box helicase [Actinotalea sp. M2MS4P-6]